MKTKINSIVPLYHSTVTKLDATVTSVSLEQGRYLSAEEKRKRRGTNIEKVLAPRKLKMRLTHRRRRKEGELPVRKEGIGNARGKDVLGKLKKTHVARKETFTELVWLQSTRMED
jgi:hypothetical protein